MNLEKKMKTFERIFFGLTLGMSLIALVFQINIFSIFGMIVFTFIGLGFGCQIPRVLWLGELLSLSAKETLEAKP